MFLFRLIVFFIHPLFIPTTTDSSLELFVKTVTPWMSWLSCRYHLDQILCMKMFIICFIRSKCFHNQIYCQLFYLTTKIKSQVKYPVEKKLCYQNWCWPIPVKMLHSVLKTGLSLMLAESTLDARLHGFLLMLTFFSFSYHMNLSFFIFMNGSMS